MWCVCVRFVDLSESPSSQILRKWSPAAGGGSLQLHVWANPHRGTEETPDPAVASARAPPADDSGLRAPRVKTHQRVKEAGRFAPFPALASSPVTGRFIHEVQTVARQYQQIQSSLALPSQTPQGPLGHRREEPRVGRRELSRLPGTHSRVPLAASLSHRSTWSLSSAVAQKALFSVTNAPARTSGAEGSGRWAGWGRGATGTAVLSQQPQRLKGGNDALCLPICSLVLALSHSNTPATAAANGPGFPSPVVKAEPILQRF